NHGRKITDAGEGNLLSGSGVVYREPTRVRLISARRGIETQKVGGVTDMKWPLNSSPFLQLSLEPIHAGSVRCTEPHQDQSFPRLPGGAGFSAGCFLIVISAFAVVGSSTIVRS